MIKNWNTKKMKCAKCGIVYFLTVLTVGLGKNGAWKKQYDPMIANLPRK